MTSTTKQMRPNGRGGEGAVVIMAADNDSYENNILQPSAIYRCISPSLQLVQAYSCQGEENDNIRSK